MTSFVYEIFIKGTHLFVGNCLFIPFHLHSALKQAAAPPGRRQRGSVWKHRVLNITSCLSRALGGDLLSEGCIASIVPVGLGGSSHAGTLLTAPEHPPRPPHPHRLWSSCPGCPRGFGWRSPCTRTLRTPSFVQTCHPCHFIFPFFHVDLVCSCTHLAKEHPLPHWTAGERRDTGDIHLLPAAPAQAQPSDLHPAEAAAGSGPPCVPSFPGLGTVPSAPSPA